MIVSRTDEEIRDLYDAAVETWDDAELPPSVLQYARGVRDTLTWLEHRFALTPDVRGES